VNNWFVLEQLDLKIKNNLLQQKSAPSLRGGAGSVTDYDYSLPAQTTLYQAIVTARLQGIFAGSSCVRLENEMDPVAKPGDFNHIRYMPSTSYWSPQPWVARRYAEYLLRGNRVPSEICVLRMACPVHFFNGPHTWNLEYGDDWRKMVWYSRKSVTCPADLIEKFTGKKTITGPLTMISDLEFKRSKSWTQTNPSNRYVRSGETALRYAFCRTRYFGGQ
jgi:hypothetical protein